MGKTYDQFRASLLYCNKCGQAMPVLERLLLVLPTGERFDYLCRGCGTSLGSKTEKSTKERQPLSSFASTKIPPKR